MSFTTSLHSLQLRTAANSLVQTLTSHPFHRALSNRLINTPTSRPFCTSQPKVSEKTPEKRDGATIMEMSANKATRFVYMRTLPLQKQTELIDEVDAIATAIETSTKSICEKHSTSVIDNRAAVHLHTAALAIATHRVLSPRIKNEIRLTNMIRAGFGAALLPDPADPQVDTNALNGAEKQKPDYWIVRAALWFAFDKMKAVRNMTANMVRDFGASFETQCFDEEQEGFQQHTLVVSKFTAGGEVCGKDEE